MPGRPRSVIGRVGDGGLRDVGGSRDRDGRHSVGDRGRVILRSRVKALRRRVVPLTLCLSVAPPERLSDRSVASVEGDAARVTVMV